jgi:hypothetical protein
VPFAPELFSAPALQRILDKYRGERLRSVPFFDGLMTGEIDALLESPPQAGLAVYVRGDSGKLAAARIYGAQGSNRSTHWSCQAGGSQGSPK